MSAAGGIFAAARPARPVPGADRRAAGRRGMPARCGSRPIICLPTGSKRRRSGSSPSRSGSRRCSTNLSEEDIPEARIKGNLRQDRPLFRVRPARGDPRCARCAARPTATNGPRPKRRRSARSRRWPARSASNCSQESPYQLHFVDEMRMEYGIMVRLIHHPDFKEGVRALLIDKDNEPNWHPTNPAVIGDARGRRILRAAAGRGAVAAVRFLRNRR